MTIGERIRKSRERAGYSQTELASKIGISKQNLYKYENGIITNIPSDKIESIAKVCETSPAFLMGWEDATTSIMGIDMEAYGLRAIARKRFRVLGKIACGEPIYANEDYETYIEASADIDADFCLTAKGDSMINARIFDGDVVFIREQPDVENGEIAAVIIGDEVTLKRVYKYQNRIELRPENPTHRVQNYEGEELNNIRILGKAVAFQSYIR